MAREEQDGGSRKRFAKSGHTRHQPPPAARPGPPPQQPPPHQPPPQYGPPQYGPPPYGPPPYGPPQYGPPPYGPPQYGPPTYAAPPQYGPPDQGFGAATYHSATPTDQAAQQAADDQHRVSSAAKATAMGTGRAAKLVTAKVIAASKANGAHESGLTALIWNQVLSYGTDAMITVALASTVFFGASTHAQRGNVLVYLLVTMAPFAVVAPVIGPALDRLQHGRRWAMAGSALGRAILAVIMAGHATDLVVLYPCALGSLVLSKAYSVVRGAAAPRLVPSGMTLVEANARLSIFGLGSALVGGGFVGIVIKLTGSDAAGLWVTAIAFGACAFFALKLPSQVDSAQPADRHPEEPARPRVQVKVPPLSRIMAWAKRGFLPPVIISLQGESALRFMSGFLTIFMAFWVESTRHGWQAAASLGAVIGAAGVGNFIGTGLGARLKLARPERVISLSTAIAAGAAILTAVIFSIDFAVVGMLVVAACNSLGKIALDAVIQRDVPETLRSSSFARSETFLQLAWVLGAAIGCLLPANNGSLGFWISGAVGAAVAIFLVLRNRVMNRATSVPGRPDPPGNVTGGPSPQY